jgi:hypothetical protein
MTPIMAMARRRWMARMTVCMAENGPMMLECAVF